MVLPVAFEQHIQDLWRHVETRLFQARNRIGKIYQPALGGFRQDPKRTDHGQVPLRCDAAPGTVVHDESGRSELFR